MPLNECDVVETVGPKIFQKVIARWEVGLDAVRGSLYGFERCRLMGATEIVLSTQDGAIHSMLERAPCRGWALGNAMGPVFASRVHFFVSIIVSAAEISSKLGAFHRRTVQPPALAR